MADLPELKRNCRDDDIQKLLQQVIQEDEEEELTDIKALTKELKRDWMRLSLGGEGAGA